MTRPLKLVPPPPPTPKDAFEGDDAALVHAFRRGEPRARACVELDPDHDGSYRVAPPPVRRFPSERAAVEAASARYAARSAAALGALAILELCFQFAMVPVKMFHCFGPGGTVVWVPDLGEYALLIGLVVAVVAIELPRRSAILGPIRDLLEARGSAEAPRAR